MSAMTYEDLLERAKTEGFEAMSTPELISIIIGGGRKGDGGNLRVAEEISTDYGLYCKAARARNFGELNLTAGSNLTRRQEAKLLSAMELARRINDSGAERKHISSPADAADYMMPKLRNETHERFIVVMMDTKNLITAVRQIAEGSLTSAVVHPREVYSPAVALHAACILAVHNHPSGNPEPSSEDIQLTQALDKAGDTLGIPLLDHIIIGDGRYFSFKEHGQL